MKLIINGETKTGVTTFFIEKEIDTGMIIFQKEVEILPNENAGQLHDKLMNIGGELIVNTVDAIINEEVKPIPQEKLADSEIKAANKIFKPFCEVNWKQETKTIYDFIRGLSPYPTAWSKLVNEDGKFININTLFSLSSNLNFNIKHEKILFNIRTAISIWLLNIN